MHILMFKGYLEFRCNFWKTSDPWECISFNLTLQLTDSTSEKKEEQLSGEAYKNTAWLSIVEVWITLTKKKEKIEEMLKN